ncbi:hypothetical protein C6P40_001332 [Pichia californica]|uniref:RRM domain-containing protein n=1 Tax=Pichia californica TaxID=460514 RepID=A0A9P7BER7_9ASCO|nr:hypothetical protein C6P42_001438 [[Candida] californica]KAG0688156.1 hypothetical protein C6P40_001332 [[Candida] californica]
MLLTILLKFILLQEFFQGSVGPVSNLTLAYNERGRSTGVATITFKNSKSARAAVARFNNANIDGGNSRLKLEIIVDTSKVPLSARIQPNLSQPVRSQQPNQPPVRRGRQAQTLKGRPGRAVNRPNKVSNKKDAPKKQPKKKKTIEELDQEMADYFATNNN